MFREVVAGKARSGESQNSPAKDHKIDSLTGMRFIAAMMVVAFHFTGLFRRSPEWVRQLIQHGNVAVSFFFLLSGFVLVYTYSSLERGFRGNLRDFWVARFSRIYPVYLLATVLFVPAIFIGLSHASLVPDFLASMTLTQAWTGFLRWNRPGWSISDEAFFYAIFPFACGALVRLSRRRLMLAMLALWLLSLVPPVLLHFGVWQQKMLNTVFYNPVLRLPEFLIGACLGRLFLLSDHRPNGTAMAVCGLLTVVFALGAASRLPSVALHNGLLAPAFAITIYGLASGAGYLGEFLSSAPMVLLGESSYAVYILQSPVWMFVKGIGVLVCVHFLHRTVDWNDSVTIFLIYCGFLVAVSIAIFRQYEVPMRKALRGYLTQEPAKA